MISFRSIGPREFLSSANRLQVPLTGPQHQSELAKMPNVKTPSWNQHSASPPRSIHLKRPPEISTSQDDNWCHTKPPPTVQLSSPGPSKRASTVPKSPQNKRDSTHSQLRVPIAIPSCPEMYTVNNYESGSSYPYPHKSYRRRQVEPGPPVA